MYARSSISVENFTSAVTGHLSQPVSMSHRRHIVLVGAASILGLVLLVKFLLREPRIDVQAENYARAFCAGDMRFLARYIPDYELEKLHMTRDRAVTILNEIVAPKLTGIRYAGLTERVINGQGLSGIAFYKLRLPSGAIVPCEHRP